MKKTTALLAIFLFAMLTIGARSAFAQGGATGALDGTVLDSSGGAVGDAGVTITDERTGNYRAYVANERLRHFCRNAAAAIDLRGHGEREGLRREHDERH